MKTSVIVAEPSTDADEKVAEKYSRSVVRSVVNTIAVRGDSFDGTTTKRRRAYSIMAPTPPGTSSSTTATGAYAPVQIAGLNTGRIDWDAYVWKEG